MKIEQLDWDTVFFGLKIGRISLKHDSDFDLTAFAQQIKDENYRLIYVFKYDALLPNDFVKKAQLELVDIQITMSKKFDRELYRNMPYTFRTALSKKELLECYKVAEATSIVSRFYTEKLIGAIKTRELYRKWIDNALTKTFSDGLFIEKESNAVSGIHLLKTDKDNNIGIFTLTGVNPELKRSGIGKKLWEQSFGYFANETEINLIRSPFSFQNAESFNFHLKMGFSKLEEIKYIYHYRNL